MADEADVMSNSGTPVISIYGLGYVGCVSAACLASLGYRVIGVDINSDKVSLLEQGRSPIVEDEIAELTAEMVSNGRLTVTSDSRSAVLNSDISIVCVGTPSDASGGLSTVFLEQVTTQIGSALADTDRRHVVVYRSTMLPGTCEEILIPLLERNSGKRAGVDFGVCVNPEYLREGTSVRDFFDPPKTVVGCSDVSTGQTAMELYSPLPGERIVVPIIIAEMTKYFDNSFHALKVTFANEVGSICAAVDLDSHAVMDIFLADTKLNLGPAYLRPGFAFGGSCLPKDVRALTYLARTHFVDTPVLGSLLRSNASHLERALELIMGDGRRKVGVFGLAFKSGTDDLRESPMVELCERLIGKGFDIKIFDTNVALSRLVGANRAFISQRLPHLGELLVEDIETVLEHGEILVIGSRTPEIVDAIGRSSANQLIVDLVRLPGGDNWRRRSNYRGIAW
ncbi:MAG: nucleotide sugar dehydrogenase [Actinomycetota bacterium]